MSQWITLSTAHGPVRVWQALPAGTPRAGLVVIQEIFGANAHIRHVAEQYAAEGYAVLAPAFFDLLEPGLELAYDAEGVNRGKELVTALGVDRAVSVVQAAAQQLERHGKVGTVGYCWGGTIAMLAAQRLGLPSASYYGARNVPFLDSPFKAPAIFHFGAQDASIPPAAGPGWPVTALVEVRAAVLGPNTSMAAWDSARSLWGVPVPWQLMWPTSPASTPASRRASRMQRARPSPRGAGWMRS